jgi:phage terminase large subunit GpA-like protein
VLSKEFPAGLLVITGANSAFGLRSMPARHLFLDEVDAYPPSADEEGDPVALAEARSNGRNCASATRRSIAASMPAPRHGSPGPIAGARRCGATSNGRWWASRRKRQRTCQSSGRPHPLTTWPAWFGADLRGIRVGCSGQVI